MPRCGAGTRRANSLLKSLIVYRKCLGIDCIFRYSETPETLRARSESADVKFSAGCSDIQAGVTELQPKSNCERRNNLAEALGELSIKLSIAAAQMAEFAAADTLAFEKAKTEMERLRDECDITRTELERHRAQHGC
ncbi:MAG: hypothetical protein ACJ74Z_09300 [Bryobacteraceae bacterium]